MVGFQAKRIIDNWVGFYDSERPHTALDKPTPNTAYLDQAEIPKAACTETRCILAKPRYRPKKQDHFRATTNIGERTARRLLIIGASSAIIKRHIHPLARPGTWLAGMLMRRPTDSGEDVGAKECKEFYGATVVRWDRVNWRATERP